MVFDTIFSFQAGLHYLRCKARVFPLAGRLEESRREVCRGVALIIITVGPEADVMPVNSC